MKCVEEDLSERKGVNAMRGCLQKKKAFFVWQKEHCKMGKMTTAHKRLHCRSKVLKNFDADVKECLATHAQKNCKTVEKDEVNPKVEECMKNSGNKFEADFMEHLKDMGIRL
jgi:hypothetical protein